MILEENRDIDNSPAKAPPAEDHHASTFLEGPSSSPCALASGSPLLCLCSVPYFSLIEECLFLRTQRSLNILEAVLLAI